MGRRVGRQGIIIITIITITIIIIIIIIIIVPGAAKWTGG